MTLLRTILLAWTPGLIVFACLFGASWLSAHGQAPHRYGIGHDGNYHDKDDWGSVAVQMHLVLGDPSCTHFHINDHGPQSHLSWCQEMVKSCAPYGGALNCRTDRAYVVQHLRSELLKSHAGDTFWYGLCGPPDVFYDALQGVPMATRKHLRIVDHTSKYNAYEGGVRTVNDCVGVQVIRIPNGNKKLNTKQNWQPWKGWMTKHDYESMRKAGRADASDGTVGGYLRYGVRQTTIAHLKGWIGQ